MNIFPSLPIYVKLYFNAVEVTNLETNMTVYERSPVTFSNSRLLIADFDSAQSFIRSMIKKVTTARTIFPPSLSIIMQQMEELEGGLSSVERRAIDDCGYQVGGKNVFIIEHSSPLSFDEAIAYLKQKK